MTLLKRIGYYLAGLSIGLVILSIFLKKKNTEFCYGIDCRVLKNIRSKNIVYSPAAESFIVSNSLDSLAINTMLTEADVNISKSDTSLDSCKVYFIESKHLDVPINIIVENCDKTATIKQMTKE